MKIAFAWTGITPCAGDCWRALAALPGVELKLFLDAAPDAAVERDVLHGLDYAFVRSEADARSRAAAFKPDILFAVGWHSKAVRTFVTCDDWADVPKVQCCDMPWRWKFRCFAARFVLGRYLRRFDAAYVPGRLGAMYMKWLGFRRICKGLLSIDQKRFGSGLSGGPRTGFLYVGRISPEKRIDLIEKAFARYRESGGTWTIAYHSATPYSQLPQVYAGRACLVLFSERDAWPLVMLEAKAAGLEVIASDRCGNARELGARVVKFGDVEALAREMVKVEKEAKGKGEGEQRTDALSSYGCGAWAKRTLEIAKRTVRISGWCPGMEDPANGMAVVARLLAQDAAFKDEYIVHGLWLPRGWWACLTHLGNFVRMTHGSLSPLYLEHQGKWKKRLVRPIERFFLRRAKKVLATCAAEREWILAYEPKAKVEVVDIKKYFDLGEKVAAKEVEVRGGGGQRTAHLLYLGRRHPLKGVEYLERAVEELKNEYPLSTSTSHLHLRIVSDATGDAKEAQWDWCDVLVLPTLSENFGLVVAEALERGKRVITTDGAPAWAPPEKVPSAECLVPSYDGRLIYLKGYRDGDDATRVKLLKDAIGVFLRAQA